MCIIYIMASERDTHHSSGSTHSVSDGLITIEKLTREGGKLTMQSRLHHSIKKYTKAYNLAKSLGDQETLQSCACNLGAALIAEGKPEQAIEYLQNALPQKSPKSHDKRSHNDSILADMYYNLGLGYTILGRTNQSLQSFSLAIELFIACNDIRGFAEGYHQLGEQYLRKQQLLTAAKCFEESSKASRELNDLFSQAKMLLKQRECLMKLGKEAEVLLVAKECNSICEILRISSEFCSSSDAGKKAKCFHDLGILYSKLNSHEKAFQCYEAALVNMRSCKTMGVENQEARILENLGLTCNIIQQYSRAVQLHKEAASLHGTLGNSSERGWCFYHLAEAYRNLGKYSDAERTYHVAFQIFEDAGQSHWKWKVLVGLGDLSYDRRNLDMAVHFYKDALKQLSDNYSSKDSRLFENHVTEKLVLALQVQRAGMVRIASYKNRTPVLINPELEKIVLESMSSALRLSMNFEGLELPKLPTMKSANFVKNYQESSSQYSPSVRPIRTVTNGPAPIPNDSVEGPMLRSSTVLVPHDENNCQTPVHSQHRKSRKHKKVGRRQLDSFEDPVPKGIDVYNSTTDLSLINSQSARDFRLLDKQSQLESTKKSKGMKQKKLFDKLAHKLASETRGVWRKLEQDGVRPENGMHDLKYHKTKRKHQSKPVWKSASHNEKEDAKPSTLTGSHTNQGSNYSNTSTLAKTLTSISSVEDIVHPKSQDECESDRKSCTCTSRGESESFDDEDTGRELEFSSSSGSSDEEGFLLDPSSEAAVNLGATYEKPMDEPLYATVRSTGATADWSNQDPLYETLNNTAGTCKLAQTMPLRTPDSVPISPPELPSSERPRKSVRRKGLDSDRSTSSFPISKELYPSSPSLTQYTRANRKSSLCEGSKVEQEQGNYSRQLYNMAGSKEPNRFNSEREGKNTSSVCVVL